MSSTTITTDRISILKEELDALKQERKEQALALKTSQKWVSVKKRLPEQDSQRIIVWREDRIELCWFSEGKWFTYNGTYFLTAKDVIDGVSHWMGTDWMTSQYSPAYGPGILNFLRFHWYNLTDRASDMAHDMRPKGWSKTAQLSKKPTFYRDASGKLMAGLPENIPAPKGYQRIVCNTAAEAERYSELQRRQERVEHRYQQEQRGAVEGKFAEELRSEMRTKMANARNNLNKDFMRRALERMDGKTDPTRYERESFLHSEGYEQGR
jgi:hypothetical protein